MSTTETELEKAKKELADLRRQIETQKEGQSSRVQRQEIRQPQHEPRQSIARSQTPARGKRTPIWMKVGMTIVFSPFLWSGWLYNGRMSIGGLFLLWEFWMTGPPPKMIETIFITIGWGLVTVTTAGEVVGFWAKLTRRPLPYWLRELRVAFAILFGYDLITTVLGIYARHTPGMPIDIDHIFQIIAIVLYSIIVTYLVEVVFSAIWKGL